MNSKNIDQPVFDAIVKLFEEIIKDVNELSNDTPLFFTAEED